MLSAQFAKVLSDVLSSKTRTILIVLSIMAGLTAVGTILSARILLNEGIDKSYGAVNYANGSLVTLQSFDKNFMQSFDTNNDDVDAIDARRSLTTRAMNSTNKKTNITVYSAADYGNMRVNIVTTNSGQWPPPRHEILIEKSSMDVLGVVEGETIQIETADKKLRSLRIAGTVNDLSSPPAAMLGSGYAYVDSETLEWLGAPGDFNELIFTVQKENGAEPDVQQILDKMIKKVKDAGYTVVKNQVVSEVPINSMIQILLLVLGSIGALALALSVFLIINTISAMVIQQTRLIGVMKAVGAGRTQILWMYLSVSLFYGLIALIFSIPLSSIGANMLSQYMASSFKFTIQENSIQLTTIVVQLVMALLVPTLSSLFPLNNGLHISTTQALGSNGGNPVNFGTNPIDRLLSGTNLWFARHALLRPILLSVRNIFRQKVRLSLTLVTLVVAGAVFITVFNLRTTIFDSMDRMSQMQSYDLQVNFSKEHRIEEIQKEMGRIEGVKEIDTWITNQATRVRPDKSESKGILVTGLRPKSNVVSAPLIVEGRWLIPDDENALVVTSSLLSNEPDIKLGQEITLKVNGRNYIFQVVGVALAMGSDIGGDTAYANFDYMADLLSNKTRTSTILIKMDTASGTTTDLKTRLDSQLKKDGFIVTSIQTTSEFKNNMQNNFSSILILLVIMALLLTIVGGLGLMGTMSINVIERTREIGILRAIGASNKGVNLVFMIEGVGIGIISCLFSIPTSFPITSLIANAIGNLATGTPWDGSFTALGVIIWIVIVAILSLLANYFPARNASRLTVREVLAYE